MPRASERGRLAAVAELDTIYATVPVGLCCVNRELRYVSVNEQLARYNGLSTEGGTEGLGRATTATVVHVTMGVIVSDFFLTKLFLFLFW